MIFVTGGIPGGKTGASGTRVAAVPIAGDLTLRPRR